MKISIPNTLALTVASFALASCGSMDVGDQLAARGEGPAAALGKEWKRADEMVSDGKKMVKKGEGIVEDGEAKVKKGERLRAETEQAATRAGYLQLKR